MTRLAPFQFALTLLVATSSVSEARGQKTNVVPIVTNRGQKIAHVADLTHELRKSPGNDDVAVGFLYERFGLFWCSLWTWDGKYVVYKGDRYGEISAAEASQLTGIPEADLGKPFSYRFPLGLLIIALVGACVAALGFGDLYVKWRLDQSLRGAERILRAGGNDGPERAVSYLVGRGLEPETARQLVLALTRGNKIVRRGSTWVLPEDAVNGDVIPSGMQSAHGQ